MDIDAIIFRAHDSLVLYLIEGDTISAYPFDLDSDTETIVRSFAIKSVKIHDVESLSELMGEGDVIESKYNLYIRTKSGVELHSKRDLILPLIEATEQMISENTLACGYSPLTSRGVHRLRSVIEDEYATMRSLPITISFPIFATYNYVDSSVNSEDRLKVTTINTSTMAWLDAERIIKGCMNRRADGLRCNAIFVFSYFAKLILGV